MTDPNQVPPRLTDHERRTCGRVTTSGPSLATASVRDRSAATGIVELARMVKWSVYPALARIAARVPLEADDSRLVFLVGCGRSGTTAFGRALARLPDVRYLNEPMHVWHAIDPITDSLRFFGYPGRLTLTVTDVTPAAAFRARRIFAVMQHLYPERLIVEKLPTNVLRINWLHALFPHARFLSIIRHPISVIQSICGMAATHPYRIFGKPTLNAWWGVDGYKRAQLIAEASTAVPGLIAERASFTDADCAAIEWLLSARALREAMYSAPLQGLVSTIRYEDLVDAPTSTLREVAHTLGIGADERAFKEAAGSVSGRQKTAEASFESTPEIEFQKGIFLALQEAAIDFDYKIPPSKMPIN